MMNDFVFDQNKKYVVNKNTKVEIDLRASLIDWWVFRGEIVTPSRRRRLSISDELGLSVRLVLLALMDYFYNTTETRNRMVQSDLRSQLMHNKRQYAEFLRLIITERTRFSAKMEAQYRGFFDNAIKDDVELKVKKHLDMLDQVLRENVPLFQHSLDVLAGAFIDYHYSSKTTVKVLFPNSKEKIRKKSKNTYIIKPKDSLYSLYLIFIKRKTIF